MENQITYNSNLLKGTGLIQEMLVLVEAYIPGESAQEFQKRVLKEGLLSKSTENRTIDVVRNIFRTRFLDQRLDVTTYLKSMREEYVSMEVISQLFLVYTCRANPILSDFIYEVYYLLKKDGKASVTAEDPKIFIRSAISDGRIITSWSVSTIEKVSEHINACLIDFGLVDRSKQILSFRALDLTVNYLFHELHFQGYSDMDILYHRDWHIFNLDPGSLAQIAERISFGGSFIYQNSGEILKIGWNYQKMEDFIENECRQKI
jgi:hypothetical protein